MRKSICILLLAVLSSCNPFDRKKEVFMTDSDFVENYRELSPDSTMVLINYSIDLGAFGYGKAGTAILNLSDTTKNLREYSIPNRYTQVKWIDNQHVLAYYDILPSLRAGYKHELNNLEINNITVRVSPLNYIGKDARQEIEHREVSPNGKYELVAYRYLNDQNSLNFIHISVIPFGTQIPKYGNYLIADKESDYVFFGTWTKENELELYSNSLYAEIMPYYLVQNRPKVNYNLITDDKKYGSKYRWTEILQ